MRNIGLNYIETLNKVGLTESEAKTYLNLLKRKNFTATEIAKLSGISRVKIYEILKSLIGKGLCVEIMGKVRKYAPVDPELAVKNLINRNKQQYSYIIEQQKILASNIMPNLSSLYLSEKSNRDPFDYIEVIHNQSLVANKIRMLEQAARKEILAFSKPPYAMDVTPEVYKNEVIPYRDDVDVKGIYEISTVLNKDFFQSLKMSEAAGEKVKITETVPHKIHLIDERIVVILMDNKFHNLPSSITSMVIEHPELAKALKELFRIYWEKSMTLEEFEISYFEKSVN